MEEASFRSKLVTATATTVNIVSFGVRLPNVEYVDARSLPSCAWSAVDPLHSESEMRIARLHREP